MESGRGEEEEMMGMLQLVCFIENREDAASHMLILAHYVPPRAPSEKHPTKLNTFVILLTLQYVAVV